MKRLVRAAMLAALIGAGGAANAQVYSGFDDFNDGINGDWNGHEVLGNVDEINGLKRISRNYDDYAAYEHQWINVSVVVPGPYWEYDVGTLCDGNDTFSIIGVARAPHKVTQARKRYQIGIGFLDNAESEIGLLVQDSVFGRRLVATHVNMTLKSELLGATNLDRWWLKITYNAATMKFVYWWAPYTVGARPVWIKFCSYVRPVTAYPYHLDPSLLGHIYGVTCPPSWNVGLDSFSFSFANK